MRSRNFIAFEIFEALLKGGQCDSRSAKNEIEKEKLRAERDEKIKVYEEKLDEMKNAAVQKYKDAMAEKFKCIQDYHSKLLHRWLCVCIQCSTNTKFYVYEALE